MKVQDLLEIGETGPLPFVGMGLVTLAVPYVMPSLRPQMASLLKASARLFLEAELGADNALTDRLVDASVDALMSIAPQTTKDEREHRTDRELDRFFVRARAGAHRRGFDHADAARRYHKHLSRFERALKSAQERAGSGHQQTFDRALHRIAHERLTHASAERRADYPSTNSSRV
ncbi:hypothetical protein [Bradyrhizobium sp.]|uniref:hypothetical protein n=1 Tax=Bradyrhizobium sp. TaxID=376 RepID=UPI0025B8DCCD|nr:hypothetical protein [Bradyrhizobium sp.]MBV8919882.1 hypothetical protein [Bradyrhizobium sp.]